MRCAAVRIDTLRSALRRRPRPQPRPALSPRRAGRHPRPHSQRRPRRADRPARGRPGAAGGRGHAGRPRRRRRRRLRSGPRRARRRRRPRRRRTPPASAWRPPCIASSAARRPSSPPCWTPTSRRFPAAGCREARDLAALDPVDWARAMEAAGAPVPEGDDAPGPRANTRHRRNQRLPRGRVPTPRRARARQPRRPPQEVPHAAAREPRRPRPRLRRPRGARPRPRGAARRPHGGAHDREDAPGPRPARGRSPTAARTSRPSSRRGSAGWPTSSPATPGSPFAELDYLPDNPALTAIDFGDLEPESARPDASPTCGHIAG